ncbi:MAG: flagellar hook-basal body complex protein FliE [Clostridia bacterium]|jgi:flagellar hook-basal body complex protein FliE
MNITSIQKGGEISGLGRSLGSSSGAGGTSFKDALKDALEQVNELDRQSRKDNLDLAAGTVDDLHSVMINAEKADLALQLTIQMRNKILDAYNEIMRMQI